MRAIPRDVEPTVDGVVTGVDFTAASLGAAQWVRAAFGERVHHVVVHVIEPPDAADYAAEAADLQAQLVARAQRAAEARLARSFPEIPLAQRHATPGRAADELIRQAREASADIICIGAHKHRGIRARIGTTTDRLLRSTPVPVLIVPVRSSVAPARILAAIDNSRERVAVLRWGGALTRRFGAELHVVHVPDRAYINAAKLVSGMAAAREMENTFLQQAEAWVRVQVDDAGITASSHAVAGQPAPEILALQKALAADLIIVGGRGAGAIGRTFIGSVATALVRTATCPVLVCAGDE